MERTILSHYLSLLSQDCYSFVAAKNPEDGLEAARLVQEFEETRGFTRRNRPWRSGQSASGQCTQTNFSGEHKRVVDGEPHGSVVSNNSVGAGSVAQNSSTRNTNTQANASSSQASGGRLSRSDRQGQGDRKPATCYGCGELGNIKPNCPNRVRHVRSPGHSSRMLVDGCLAGQIAKNLRIDTGAEKTVVRQDYVPEVAYTGKSCMLNIWRGSQPSRHRLARIAFKVGSVEVTKVVAVAEKLDCPALLGADLGDDITVDLMQHIIDQSARGNGVPEGARPRVSQQNEPVGSGQEKVLVVAPVRGTRAETAKKLKEIAEDESASALSECCPVELSDVLDFPDPVVTPVEELCTLPEG